MSEPQLKSAPFDESLASVIAGMRSSSEQFLRSLQQRHSELSGTWRRMASERETLKAEAEAWQKKQADLEQQVQAVTQDSQCAQGLNAELDQLRQALHQSRHENQLLQARLESPGESIDPALLEQKQALESELDAMEQELETVRSRAVQIAESAADERRQIAQERAEWLGEIRLLRQFLEQGGVVAKGQGSAPARQPAAAAEAQQGSRSQETSQEQSNTHNAATGRPEDVVLESVVAQFQLLQKDVAKRRKQQNGR